MSGRVAFIDRDRRYSGSGNKIVIRRSEPHQAPTLSPVPVVELIYVVDFALATR